MASDEDDKTVFGQPLPRTPRPGQGAPPGAAPRPASPDAGGADKTVFGQPLPSGGGRVAPAARPQSPPPASQPWNSPAPDDTWLGGAFQTTPRPQQPVPQSPPPQQQPQYRPDTGQPSPTNQIFPDLPQHHPQPEQMQRPQIGFHDALKGVDPGAGGSSNPLVRAAANLIILLGRLRTGMVELQAQPLIEHVIREIDGFERNALQAGVSPQDALDGKYALSATADDIVQNLPGANKGMWYEYSMEARFFGSRTAGVGFFQKMDEAMRAPGHRFHLLELMLTCLSLGFEGQYRAMPNGSVELARIRTAIYETLRRIQPRPDDDISVRWDAVPMGGKQRRGGTPVWVVAAVASAMIVALFATFATLLSREGAELRDDIVAMHAGLPAISIERNAPLVTAYVAPETSQLERIRAALAPEIEAGRVEVDRNNAFIFVRVGPYLQFGSGSADLTSDFDVLAARIGETLDGEDGPIRVVGHTDSIPPSGRGRYKTNEALSLARAETAAKVLASHVSDPGRIVVEGKGAVDAIADNGTRAGRARNRRVEIMIPRED